MSFFVAFVLASSMALVVVFTLRHYSAARHERPPDDPRVADRIFVRAIAFVGISSALAVNGVIQLGLLRVGTLPAIVDTGLLTVMAFAVGLATVVLLMAAAIVLLGRSPRTFKVLLEIAIIGTFGATATAFVELRRYNIGADRSPPQTVTAQVLGVEYFDTLLGPRMRIVGRQLDADGRSSPLQLTLSRGAAQGLRTNARIELAQRRGALDVRWLSSIRLVGMLGEEPAAVAPRAAAPGTSTSLTSGDWERCRLPGLPFPYAGGKVFVVDGRPQVPEGVVAEAPPHVAIDVTEPGHVVLLVTAPEMVQWRFRAAPQTTIDGVVATGRYPQNLAGLGQRTPKLSRSTAQGFACGRSWLVDGETLPPIEHVTSQIFGRDPDRVLRIDGTRLTIGAEDYVEPALPALPAPVAPAAPVARTAKEEPAVAQPAVRQPAAAKPKKPGTEILADAQRAYVLRRGSMSDVNPWIASWESRSGPLPRRFRDYLDTTPIYLIMAPFDIPDDLAGAHSVVFVRLPGVKHTGYDIGHSIVLDLQSIDCYGRMCDVLLRDD